MKKLDVKDKYKELVFEFVENRKEMNSPMTKRAIKMFVNKVNKLDAQGQDIEDLIKTAIESGWKTIFPKNNNHPGYRQPVKPPTVLGQNLDASEMLDPDEILELREKTRKSREKGMSKIKDMLYRLA